MCIMLQIQKLGGMPSGRICLITTSNKQHRGSKLCKTMNGSGKHHNIFLNSLNATGQ